ncbi:MAG: hypothetical protein M0030_19795, partial [Actinomycetota bacterium]|nr:hypothetical protein [Actinomycetota bacterium]
ITVTVDGTQVLSPTLPSGTIPPSVLVAFTGANGTATDNHVITTGSFTGGGAPIPPPGGGWSYNGSAALAGSQTFLTKAVANQAGTVVYPVPVQTAGLTVTVNLQMYGGTNGFGLTFALLNPSSESATAVGAGGPQLGFGGLNGVAAALISHYYAGYPSGNFPGVSAGTNGTILTFQKWARNIGPLRTGTHTMTVQVTSSDVLVVWVDGEQIMQVQETGLPSTALLAFTASTGTTYGNNVIRNIAISAAG